MCGLEYFIGEFLGLELVAGFCGEGEVVSEGEVGSGLEEAVVLAIADDGVEEPCFCGWWWCDGGDGSEDDHILRLGRMAPCLGGELGPLRGDARVKHEVGGENSGDGSSVVFPVFGEF